MQCGGSLFLALGVNKPGREAEAVAYCLKMAEEYPEDARNWQREAKMYRMAAVTVDLQLISVDGGE
jgi:hypothetical protein